LREHASPGGFERGHRGASVFCFDGGRSIGACRSGLLPRQRRRYVGEYREVFLARSSGGCALDTMSTTDAVSAGQVLRVAPPESAAPKSVPVPTGKAAAPTAKPAANAKLGPASASAPAPASVEASRFKWPVPGPITAKFVTGRSKGVELGGRVGEQVKAAEGGRVVYAGARIKPYRRLIVIKHDGHFVTAYGNIRKLLVEEGTVVTQGQSIAEMGADANGSGSLKFEVRKDGKPVDPSVYLPKRPG
jgi:lipoprotein NlpD